MKNNKEIDLLPDQPLGEKLIKKGFWLYFFAYFAAPAGYLTRVVVSNSVTVEEVGILYSIISFISIISIYNDLGMTESLQYFLPRFWLKKQYNFAKTAIFMSLGVQLLTAILIITILWFGAPRLGEHYFHSIESSFILRYFCFYFLGLNIFQVFQSVFISFQDTFSNKIIQFIQLRFMVGFTGLFFLLGKGSILNYSLSWILGLVVAIVASIIIFGGKYKQVITKGELVYDRTMIDKYKRYALWVFLGANAGVLLGHIDQQMIVFILGATSAGYYANYLSLLNLSAILVLPIIGLIIPLVTELIVKKDNKSLGVLQNFIYTYIGIFGLTIGALFMVLGPELSLILFGEKFIYSGNLLVLGGGFSILGILIAINFSMLVGLGKVKERVKIIASVGVLNIVMNLIFMQFWGLYGVIVSTIIGGTLMTVFSFILINKNQKICVQRNLIFKNLFVIIILSGIIYKLKGLLFIYNNSYRFNNLVILLIIGIVYYLLFVGLNLGMVISFKNEILKLKK